MSNAHEKQAYQFLGELEGIKRDAARINNELWKLVHAARDLQQRVAYIERSPVFGALDQNDAVAKRIVIQDIEKNLAPVAQFLQKGN